MTARFTYLVMFVGDDGYLTDTIPPTRHVTRKAAAEVVRELRNRHRDVRIRVTCRCGWWSGNHIVWSAVDEQRRFHAGRCPQQVAS